MSFKQFSIRWNKEEYKMLTKLCELKSCTKTNLIKGYIFTDYIRNQILNEAKNEI